MNRNIGEVFDYNGVKLKVVDDPEGDIHPCKGCYFLDNFDCLSDKRLRKIIGECSSYQRQTHEGVRFIEIKEDKNMKTNEEILEYIEKQDWYEAFCKNFVKSSISNYDGKEHLSLDYTLISSAFNWLRTTEGYDYWFKIDDEYRRWYKQQPIVELKPIVELTIEQIAEKFEIPVESVRIKD